MSATSGRDLRPVSRVNVVERKRIQGMSGAVWGFGNPRIVLDKVVTRPRRVCPSAFAMQATLAYVCVPLFPDWRARQCGSPPLGYTLQPKERTNHTSTGLNLQTLIELFQGKSRLFRNRMFQVLDECMGQIKVASSFFQTFGWTNKRWRILIRILVSIKSS